MQKVEGSSPFSALGKAAQERWFRSPGAVETSALPRRGTAVGYQTGLDEPPRPVPPGSAVQLDSLAPGGSPPRLSIVQKIGPIVPSAPYAKWGRLK